MNDYEVREVALAHAVTLGHGWHSRDVVQCAEEFRRFLCNEPDEPAEPVKVTERSLTDNEIQALIASLQALPRNGAAGR